jgi:hypothetical protein
MEHISPSQLFHMLKHQLDSWDIGIGDVLLAMSHARTGGQKMANISLKVSSCFLKYVPLYLTLPMYCIATRYKVVRSKTRNIALKCILVCETS